MQTSFPPQKMLWLPSVPSTHNIPPLEGRHPKLSSSPGQSSLPHALVARMTWNTEPPLCCSGREDQVCGQCFMWCFMFCLRLPRLVAESGAAQKMLLCQCWWFLSPVLADGVMGWSVASPVQSQSLQQSSHLSLSCLHSETLCSVPQCLPPSPPVTLNWSHLEMQPPRSTPTPDSCSCLTILPFSQPASRPSLCFRMKTTIPPRSASPPT